METLKLIIPCSMAISGLLIAGSDFEYCGHGHLCPWWAFTKLGV